MFAHVRRISATVITKLTLQRLFALVDPHMRSWPNVSLVGFGQVGASYLMIPCY